MAPQPSFYFRFIEGEDGRLIGFTFGADFTSEHEQGIRELQDLFAVNPPPKQGFFDKLFRRPPSPPRYGIAARQSTRFPEDRIAFFKDVHETEGVSYFLAVDAARYGMTFYRPEAMRYYAHFRPGNDIACAWDSSAAVIRVREAHAEKLREMLDAMRRCDFALGNRVPGMPGRAGGLCFYIVSRVPEQYKEAWERSERERAEEQARLAAWWDKNASDVIPALRAAKLNWYALGGDPGTERCPRPRRFSQNDDGIIRVWLNPVDQYRYNSGWFSADDLRAWARGEGPVMKKTKAGA